MTDKWTKALMDNMRETGDPLADDVIKTIFTKGEVTEVNEVFRALVKNDGVPSQDLPDIVRDYLVESARLPDWADPVKIKAGEKLFREYGLMSVTMLFCASLPRCYTAEDGVRVLWHTQRLSEHIERRLVETGQMVVDVMSGGGLEANGNGIRSAQKVRLMHAAIRQMILSDPNPGSGSHAGLGTLFSELEWEEDWGMPISQEALCGTLMAFSYEVIVALRSIGVHFGKDEEDAYIHCWNVVGHIMGVREELMVQNMEEAEVLADLLTERNARWSQEGVDLTDALVEFMGDRMKESIPFGRFLPVSHIPKIMIFILIGKENCDMIGIRPDIFDYILLFPLKLMLKFVGHLEYDISHDVPFGRVLSEWIFRKMTKAMMGMERGKGRPTFEIPTHLAAAWKVENL